jgi:hypothetical protein
VSSCEVSRPHWVEGAEDESFTDWVTQLTRREGAAGWCADIMSTHWHPRDLGSQCQLKEEASGGFTDAVGFPSMTAHIGEG